jgi:hypothetical protein
MPTGLGRSLFAVTATVVLCVQRGAAQVTETAVPSVARQWTFAAGLGNSLGWFGLQGERHVSQNRLSVFVGLGYTPAIDAGEPSGLTVAAGGRAFSSGTRHRGFLELAFSQISIERSVDGNRYYGPAAQIGYQYTARRGFTLFVSAGAGYSAYAVGDDTGFDEESEVFPRWQPVVGLGAGHTWR